MSAGRHLHTRTEDSPCRDGKGPTWLILGNYFIIII